MNPSTPTTNTTSRPAPQTWCGAGALQTDAQTGTKTKILPKKLTFVDNQNNSDLAHALMEFTYPRVRELEIEEHLGNKISNELAMFYEKCLPRAAKQVKKFAKSKGPVLLFNVCAAAMAGVAAPVELSGNSGDEMEIDDDQGLRTPHPFDAEKKIELENIKSLLQSNYDSVRSDLISNTHLQHHEVTSDIYNVLSSIEAILMFLCKLLDSQCGPDREPVLLTMLAKVFVSAKTPNEKDSISAIYRQVDKYNLRQLKEAMDYSKVAGVKEMFHMFGLNSSHLPETECAFTTVEGRDAIHLACMESLPQNISGLENLLNSSTRYQG